MTPLKVVVRASRHDEHDFKPDPTRVVSDKKLDRFRTNPFIAVRYLNFQRRVNRRVMVNGAGFYSGVSYRLSAIAPVGPGMMANDVDELPALS